MNATKKIVKRRNAFTLVEMVVVIAIILVIAGLAASFAPRVDDNQKMSRAVDNLEQWLLTAKMRAKRDGLSTGLRFVWTQGDANIDPGLKMVPPVHTIFSQFQYIQQPPPLTGGICIGGPPNPMPPAAGVYQYPVTTGNYYTGGLLISAGYKPDGITQSYGEVNFQGVDFWLGNLTMPLNPLVQQGDYLEVNGGGVYFIGSTTSPTTLQLGASLYDLAVNWSMTPSWPTPPPPPTPPTTNYRILRQPRLLIGEEPLTLPNNYAVNSNPIPGSGSPLRGTNVALGFSQYPEILFSPTGAVVGTNSGTSTLFISVWDTTMDINLPDAANRVGIVGVQSRSGFIGAYSVSLSGNPFYFVQTARESGL